MKNIDNYDFRNKKVIVRVDFNVPLDTQFNVTDDTRIKATIPTIKKILQGGGSVILMSHLGRPKGGPEDKFSLRHILDDLSKKLGVDVQFADDCIGESAQHMAAGLQPGQVLLLENLRFYKEEEAGDVGFAKKLADLADVYMNDAFGTAHRAHASTAVIAQFFPENKLFGYVMGGEVSSINMVLKEGHKPVTAILGGAKVSGKIEIINNLLDKVDNLVIGGGMMFTFIKAMGGKMIGFMSNTGGLVAPEYDNNPWNYKFTWNPRNVVLAGQSVAQYKEQGQYKFIPYHKLFTRATKFSVLHLGEFEMYPNRDSLSYREIYGLEDIPSILRGTFRRPGYCNAWNVFVQLGATDDSYVMEGSENMTYRDYINSFLAFDQKLSVEEKLCKYTGITPDSDVFKRIKWLGVFENTKVGMKDATPAQILQKILEAKLSLCSEDKDLIVMQHVFDFELNGKKKRIKSSLICTGIDTVHTAMSITVGTPVAIATKMLLTGQINLTGVHVPVIPELYNPILKELEEHGIKFIEEEEEL